MLTGFDHVIIGVNNLEQATNTFTQRLGLVASGGGTHPTGGTANRIIVIGDTYLELISVRVREEAQASMLELLARGEGYLNCVFGSDDLQADSEAIAKRGIHIIGPKEGQLKAADGRVRAWLRTDIERADLAQHYPFLIQHDSVGEERCMRLAGWQTPPVHPLGAHSVVSATLVVSDLEEAVARFQHIYGLKLADSYTNDYDTWNARLAAFILGEQHFELAAPIDAARQGAQLPEPGALAWHLQRFGESLCRITLAVKDLAVARQYLDKQAVSYSYPEGSSRPQLWIHPEEACGAAIVLREG